MLRLTLTALSDSGRGNGATESPSTFRPAARSGLGFASPTPCARVAAFDAEAAMGLSANPDLEEVTRQAKARLRRALERL